MNKSDTIGELAKALAKAQSQFTPVKRGTKVDFTTKTGAKIKYNYAPLADVLDSCSKALNDNELVVVQPTKVEDNKNIVETMLIHSSGEWLSGEMQVIPVDRNPQSEGSALTYARRYGVSALLDIAADEDDDAESAMARDSKPTAKTTHQTVVQSAEEAGAVEEPAQTQTKPQVKTPSDPITEGQVRNIHAKLSFMGIEDEFDRHDHVSKVLQLDKTITSFNLLTKGQASKAIDMLQDEMNL